MGNLLLSLRKLSVKAQDGKSILREISFDFQAGQVLGVYGPNGSGKSSLLKAICGLETSKVLTGEFWLGAENLMSGSFSAAEKAKKAIYLGSDFISPFELSVRDLLEMGVKVGSTELWPTITHTERDRISRVVESMELLPFLSRSVNTLSDGEKQWVMFARCLIQNPEILVLDESFSKLDLDKWIVLTRLVRDFKKEGMTFFVVSHDLIFLSEISDQLLILRNGEQLGMGAVSSLLTANMMERLYPNHAAEIIRILGI